MAEFRQAFILRMADAVALVCRRLLHQVAPVVRRLPEARRLPDHVPPEVRRPVRDACPALDVVAVTEPVS